MQEKAWKICKEGRCFVEFFHSLDSCKILKWKSPKNQKNPENKSHTSAGNNLAISKKVYMKIDSRKIGLTTHEEPFLKHLVC